MAQKIFCTTFLLCSASLLFAEDFKYGFQNDQLAIIVGDSYVRVNISAETSCIPASFAVKLIQCGATVSNSQVRGTGQVEYEIGRDILDTIDLELDIMQGTINIQKRIDLKPYSLKYGLVVKDRKNYVKFPAKRGLNLLNLSSLEKSAQINFSKVEFTKKLASTDKENFWTTATESDQGHLFGYAAATSVEDSKFGLSLFPACKLILSLGRSVLSVVPPGEDDRVKMAFYNLLAIPVSLNQQRVFLDDSEASREVLGDYAGCQIVSVEGVRCQEILERFRTGRLQNWIQWFSKEKEVVTLELKTNSGIVEIEYRVNRQLKL